MITCHNNLLNTIFIDFFNIKMLLFLHQILTNAMRNINPTTEFELLAI